jgi:hypothetical protein
MRAPSSLFLSVLALLMLGTAVFAAPAEEPRPTILIIGDLQALPQQGSSWIELMGAQHPEWRIVWNIAAERAPANAAAQLDTILAPYTRIDAVLIALGTGAAGKAAYALQGAPAHETGLSDLIRKLRLQPKTAKAKIAVTTPMPVVEKRLPKNDIDAFTGGEARAKLLADAYRKAITKEKVILIDVAAWILADKDDKGPGRLMGDAGWLVPDRGLVALATYLTEALAKQVGPQAPDTAKFATWKATFDAGRKLDELLARTSGGTVAHGERLAAATFADWAGTATVTNAVVPPALLRGSSLDLLVTADAKTLACVAPGSASTGRPYLCISTEENTAHLIMPSPVDWQLIDESARPVDPPVEPWRYSQDRGRAHYYAVMRDAPGKRVCLLIRFPLDTIAGKKPATAVVRFEHKAVDQFDADLMGSVACYPITGPDRAWSAATATWYTRDGITGWTGGEVQQARRRTELDAFLKTILPEEVRKRAEAELRKLP